MSNSIKKLLLVALIGVGFAFAKDVTTPTEPVDKTTEVAPNPTYGSQTGVSDKANIQEPGSREAKKHVKKVLPKDDATDKANQDPSARRGE